MLLPASLEHSGGNEATRWSVAIESVGQMLAVEAIKFSHRRASGWMLASEGQQALARPPLASIQAKPRAGGAHQACPSTCPPLRSQTRAERESMALASSGRRRGQSSSRPSPTHGARGVSLSLPSFVAREATSSLQRAATGKSSWPANQIERANPPTGAGSRPVRSSSKRRRCRHKRHQLSTDRKQRKQRPVNESSSCPQHLPQSVSSSGSSSNSGAGRNTWPARPARHWANLPTDSQRESSLSPRANWWRPKSSRSGRAEVKQGEPGCAGW